MRGLGTTVNVATVLVGTVVGLVAGGRIPERARTTVFQGVGLITLVLGFMEAGHTRNLVFPIVAIVVGGLVGEALHIEDGLERLGRWVEARAVGDAAARPAHAHPPGRVAEAFLTASLVFCVGPLTVLGAIQDGLGHPQLLIVKASLDGLVAVVFAATLGWGVAASAVTILVYQGGLALATALAGDVLTHRMVAEMTATGGVMILGIGLRLLDLAKVRVASFLPGLVIAPLAVALFAR